MRQTLVEPELQHLANIFMRSRLPRLTISIYHTVINNKNYLGIRVKVADVRFCHVVTRTRQGFRQSVLKKVRKLYHHMKRARDEWDSDNSDSSPLRNDVGFPPTGYDSGLD